jgi:hypothetical protein
MPKHIEFTLPRSRAADTRRRIELVLVKWVEEQGIRDFDIRSNVYTSVLAFTLSDEQLYTLFLLAWNEDTLPQPRMVTSW